MLGIEGFKSLSPEVADFCWCRAIQLVKTSIGSEPKLLTEGWQKALMQVFLGFLSMVKV